MRANATLGLKFRNILRTFQGAGSTLCPADCEDVSNVRQPRHFSVRPRAMWQRRFCTPLERGGRRACFRPPCFWRRQTSSALSVAGFDSLAVVASVRGLHLIVRTARQIRNAAPKSRHLTNIGMSRWNSVISASKRRAEHSLNTRRHQNIMPENAH